MLIPLPAFIKQDDAISCSVDKSIHQIKAHLNISGVSIPMIPDGIVVTIDPDRSNEVFMTNLTTLAVTP